MANIIDYYEELDKISPSMSAADIMTQLIKQERMWAQRESVMPEKAQKKLVIITDAKKVFASESAKKKYDRDLADSKRPPEKKAAPDPNSSRRADLNKWYNDAMGFYNSRQYDLAKTSIEKAMSFLNTQEENAEFYEFAACVYRENGYYDQAMDYINKAIVESPDSPQNYITKALIFNARGRAALNDRYNAGNAAGFFQKGRDTLNLALSYAERNSNYSAARAERGRIYGLLGFSYFHYQPRDRKLAMDYAIKGREFGDNSGNSANVISEIEKEMESERKAEEARLSEQRRQEARQRHLAQEQEKARLQKQEEERQKKLREEAKAREFKRHNAFYVLSWIAIVLFWLLLGFLVIKGKFTGLNPYLTSAMFAALLAVNGFNETARYGFWEDYSPKISLVLVAVFFVVAGSLKYHDGGYNALSAKHAWQFGGIVTAMNILILIFSRVIGKTKAK